jgi:hypothetical protein
MPSGKVPLQPYIISSLFHTAIASSGREKINIKIITPLSFFCVCGMGFELRAYTLSFFVIFFFFA